MKKFILIAAILLCTSAVYAQEDVTKFLGIPVDGTKAEMIAKLKAKGFTSTEYDKDILEGEFNGRDVQIHVVTNKNKVYRIMVADKNFVNESSIKIRFNTLCRQFENNSKYTSFGVDYSIPDDENISYNMSVKKKRYQASYFQLPNVALQKSVWFMIAEYLGDYYIEIFYDNGYNQANGEDL